MAKVQGLVKTFKALKFARFAGWDLQTAARFYGTLNNLALGADNKQRDRS